MQRYGRYEVLELVGRGGFGEVFKARDTDLGRTVAIKTCRSDVPDVRDRFVREGRIAGNLQHPNIVVVHELGFQPDNVPYLVQEYIEGRDLRQILSRGESPVEMKRKMVWLAATADALHYAHARGVIHRDIKPANIRIGTRGDIRLLDFGVARLLETATELTRTGETIGTVSYVPPEMLKGQPATQRCDVFSWGVTAYELITGRKPFRGDSISRILFEILSASPQAPKEVEPSCPSRLSDLVLDTLRKDPERRCPGFDEIVTRIRRSRRQYRRENKAAPLGSAEKSTSDPLSTTAVTLALPDLDSMRDSATRDGDEGEHDPALDLFGAFRDGLTADG